MYVCYTLEMEMRYGAQTAIASPKRVVSAFAESAEDAFNGDSECPVCMEQPEAPVVTKCTFFTLLRDVHHL